MIVSARGEGSQSLYVARTISQGDTPPPERIVTFWSTSWLEQALSGVYELVNVDHWEEGWDSLFDFLSSPSLENPGREGVIGTILDKINENPDLLRRKHLWLKALDCMSLRKLHVDVLKTMLNRMNQCSDTLRDTLWSTILEKWSQRWLDAQDVDMTPSILHEINQFPDQRMKQKLWFTCLEKLRPLLHTRGQTPLHKMLPKFTIWTIASAIRQCSHELRWQLWSTLLEYLEPIKENAPSTVHLILSQVDQSEEGMKLWSKMLEKLGPLTEQDISTIRKLLLIAKRTYGPDVWDDLMTRLDSPSKEQLDRWMTWASPGHKRKVALYYKLKKKMKR